MNTSQRTPKDAKGLTWPDRCRRILHMIEDAGADIVCLQEVEREAFTRDIAPALTSMGYESIIQGDDRVKDSRKRKSEKSPRAHLVATFWKAARFQPVSKFAYLARSRTLATVLQQNSDGGNTNSSYVAVVNCHLEGHPLKSSARVRQLHHAMRDLSRRHAVLNGLIVCGDFNCELQSSACTTYLKVGYCPPQHKKQRISHVSGDMALALPGVILEYETELEVTEPIMEWGTPVPGSEIEAVPSHPYKENNMTSAFPSALGRENPREHFTYAARPGHPVAGLDQIWYSGSTLHVTALKKMLRSDDERRCILESGLPSKIMPSDHLPIGCVLEWECSNGGRIPNKGARGRRTLIVSTDTETHRGAEVSLGATSLTFTSKSEILEEIRRLLEDCPFENDDQRNEFDFVTSEVPGLPSDGKKPSDKQIEQLVERRSRKKKLLNTVSDEAREVMSRVIRLQKEASHPFD